MAHFSPSAPLLYCGLMAHLHMVRHYYLVMAHHMYSAPLIAILDIALFLVVCVGKRGGCTPPYTGQGGMPSSSPPPCGTKLPRGGGAPAIGRDGPNPWRQA